MRLRVLQECVLDDVFRVGVAACIARQAVRAPTAGPSGSARSIRILAANSSPPLRSLEDVERRIGQQRRPPASGRLHDRFSGQTILSTSDRGNARQ